MAAALGRAQLTRIDGFLAKREAIATRYDAVWRDLPVVLPPRPSQGDTHAWHIYASRLDWEGVGKQDRDPVIARLSEEGISTSVHYVPLHRHPRRRDRDALTPERCPRAKQVYRGIGKDDRPLRQGRRRDGRSALLHHIGFPADPTRSRDPEFNGDLQAPSQFDRSPANNLGLATSIQQSGNGEVSDFFVAPGAGGIR